MQDSKPFLRFVPSALPGLDAGQVQVAHDIAQRLLDHSAVAESVEEEARSLHDIASGCFFNAEPHISVAQLLQERGVLMQCQEGSFAFPVASLALLEGSMMLTNPTSLGECRKDISILDMSVMELCSHLSDKGWQQVKWRKRGCPSPFAFHEKVFYVKTGLNAWYLRALAAAEDLQALGVQPVPQSAWSTVSVLTPGSHPH